MRAFADLVTIGRVVKPQGRKGEVLTECLSDRPERFPSLRSVYVPTPGGGAREVAVASCWPHKGRFVLKLDGVDSIDDAEAYRGVEIRITEEDLPRLDDGAYYHHQLLGLDAEDGAGRPLGAVAAILEIGGGVPVLTVRGPAGECLVPFAAAFVHTVDLERKRIVVSPPLADEVNGSGPAGPPASEKSASGGAH